jgi:hypothetical protein
MFTKKRKRVPCVKKTTLPSCRYVGLLYYYDVNCCTALMDANPEWWVTAMVKIRWPTVSAAKIRNTQRRNILWVLY